MQIKELGSLDSEKKNQFLQVEREQAAPPEDWKVQDLILQLEMLSEQEYPDVDEAIRLYRDIPEALRSSPKVKNIIEYFFDLVLMWGDLTEMQRCAHIFGVSDSYLKSKKFHDAAKWGIIEHLVSHKFLDAAQIAERTGTEDILVKEIKYRNNTNLFYAVKAFAAHRDEAESAGRFFEFLLRYPEYRPSNIAELLMVAVYNPTIAGLVTGSADARSWVKPEEWGRLNALALAVQAVETTRKDETQIEGKSHRLHLLAGAEKIIPLEFQTDPLAFALSHGAELIKRRTVTKDHEIIWKFPAMALNSQFVMKLRQRGKTKISEDQEMRILEVARALQLPGVRPLGTLELMSKYKEMKFDITEYKEGIPGTNIREVLRGRGKSPEEIERIVVAVNVRLQEQSQLYGDAMSIDKYWNIKDCLIRLSADDTVEEVIPLDWERASFKVF